MDLNDKTITSLQTSTRKRGEGSTLNILVLSVFFYSFSVAKNNTLDECDVMIVVV